MSSYRGSGARKRDTPPSSPPLPSASHLQIAQVGGNEDKRGVGESVSPAVLILGVDGVGPRVAAKVVAMAGTMAETALMAMEEVGVKS